MLVSVVACFVSISILSTSSLAGPDGLTSTNDIHTLEQRQNNFTAVTGVISGGVQPRLEVRQLYNTQPAQWNLFLLAMQRMKSQPQSDQFSFYQIAGIHGVPNVPWDGVTQNPNSQGAVGYCTHDSVLFPAWHRAYLALFEQVFYDNVQAVVQTFPAGPLRDNYTAAAQTIRFPYWDWAAAPQQGLPTFPYIISNKYTNVNTSTGQQTILNPLFRYDFNPLVPSDMLYQPWSQWGVTFRWPTNNGSNSSTPATSQNNLAQTAIENSRLNRRDNLYNLFTLCNDYLEFSNDAASSSSQGCHTSLEGIHNQIHSLVGGTNNGHMTWLWWGAFDPVFFLHHANVDRLFAMWQAIYPNSYGANQSAPGSTFTIAKGTMQGPDSPLTPFHSNTSGAFLTTNTAVNTTSFGYTYPEFLNGSNSSVIIGYVNSLYGPNATATAGSVMRRRDILEDRAVIANGVTVAGASGLLGAFQTRSTQYIANVAYPRWTLGGSYTVYLFMGNPKQEDGLLYPFQTNLIGSVNVLAVPGMTSNKQISTGAVPLTRALNLQIGGRLLQSLDRIFVIPFLQRALVWRVAAASGQIVPNDQVPGLEVSVVSADFTPPSSPNSFPVYQPFASLADITDGKAGGLSYSYDEQCLTPVTLLETWFEGMNS